MRRLVYLTSARADLIAIFEHIAIQGGSIAVAQGFVAKLRGRLRDLASSPGTLGRARPELRPDIRSVAHRGYVIFFRYGPDRLEVVNILEGHRDMDACFIDTDPLDFR